MPKTSKTHRRRWFRDMTTADYVLSVIGLCLGTAAALFPWHVHFHPESYGPPRMAFSRGGVIPDAEILALQSGEPVFDMRTGRFVMDDDRGSSIDLVVTGNVNRDGEAAKGDLNQAFPSNGASFEVLAVDGIRALVGDSQGVYLIRPHTRLPDGTLALSFKRDEKGWYIVTSEEKILRPL